MRRTGWLLPALSGLLLLHAGCFDIGPSQCQGQYCMPDGGTTPGGPMGGDMAPAALDPGVLGPRQVALFELNITVAGVENVLVTVVGPGDSDSKLSLTGAPYPLVVLSPDEIPPRGAYLNYARRLASYGILTVVQTPRSTDLYHQYRDDTSKVIDWLVSPTDNGADMVMGRVDKNRIGVAGHGLGGKIALLVAANDPRVKAVIGIDPVDRMDGIDTLNALDEIGKIKLPSGVLLGLLGETGSQTGTPACAPAATNYQALFAKAPSPAFAITVNGAAHNDFLDDCVTLQSLCEACAGSTAPRTRTHDLAVKYVAAYFLWALAGRPEARDFLVGTHFQGDVTAGYVTQMQK